MEYSKAFISAYQIVEYLVCEHKLSNHASRKKKSMKYGWQNPKATKQQSGDFNVIYEKR